MCTVCVPNQEKTPNSACGSSCPSPVSCSQPLPSPMWFLWLAVGRKPLSASASTAPRSSLYSPSPTPQQGEYLEAKILLLMSLMCKQSGSYCSGKDFCGIFQDPCDDVRDETEWITTHTKYYFYSMHCNLTMVSTCGTPSWERQSQELFEGSLNTG